VTTRKRPPAKDLTRELLLEEAWSIIEAAKTEKNLAAASATLERAARIAGLWTEKPADPTSAPPAQVFTSEPMTAEQWSEKFAPKDG